jgi:dCMP deaminase
MNNNWNIPTWDELFMKHVYLIASKSKDTKTKVGAVIVRNNAIISEGYNGMCKGVDDAVEDRYERPEKYFWMEHAERNSIYHCSRNGISTDSTTLYTMGLPCSDCARSIIQSGIKEIVLHEDWDHGLSLKMNRQKWSDSCIRSDIMFSEAKIQIRMFKGFLGCKTMVDGQIFDI